MSLLIGPHAFLDGFTSQCLSRVNPHRPRVADILVVSNNFIQQKKASKSVPNISAFLKTAKLFLDTVWMCLHVRVCVCMCVHTWPMCLWALDRNAHQAPSIWATAVSTGPA